jgi:SOS response associated peptidase (SRAP)
LLCSYGAWGAVLIDPKGKEKQPYAIAMADNAPMVMAGMWAKWKSPEGEQVLSCTILTCGPNGPMGELHDRMPVILDEADWPKWLGEAPATEDELVALLKPSPDASLKIWPVGNMLGTMGPTWRCQFRPATNAAVELRRKGRGARVLRVSLRRRLSLRGRRQAKWIAALPFRIPDAVQLVARAASRRSWLRGCKR